MSGKQVLAVVLIIFTGVAGVYWGTQIREENYVYQGSSYHPFPPAYDFSLESFTGEEYSLSAERGKVILIFFGYANCPDVCPTTLSEFKRIHTNLENLSDRVDFVFITIDPERDTQEDIQRYVSVFDTSFIGLSGTLKELEPVWDGFFVYRNKAASTSTEDYLMEHTTRIYIVDKNGNLRLTFPFGMAVQAMTEDIRHLVREEE